MMTGLLSGVPAMEADLIGDSSLMRRPMSRVAEPLRLMGAEISLSSEGTAPVRISGRTLEGIEYRLPVASAQVKTALILAGLHAEGRTIIEEPQRSRDHTERLMAFLGVDVTRGELRYEVTAAKLVGDRSIDIPRDFSSAAFVICAAALLPGSDVTILGCGLNPTRTAFLDILRRFGAEVEMDDVREVSGEPRGALRVRYAGTRAVRVGSSEVPGAIDELPLVAVLGTAAEGETTVEGAGELRVKESDRIRAIAEGLRRMGGDVREEADGFTVVGPTRLHGAHVDAGGDHRIAMALAVAGLAAEGETVIHGWEAADVSFPRFAEALQAVTVR
jgi:3-phosphoshikimate 1-carboxyvinyltransferase